MRTGGTINCCYFTWVRRGCHKDSGFYIEVQQNCTSFCKCLHLTEFPVSKDFFSFDRLRLAMQPWTLMVLLCTVKMSAFFDCCFYSIVQQTNLQLKGLFINSKNVKVIFLGCQIIWTIAFMNCT